MALRSLTYVILVVLVLAFGVGVLLSAPDHHGSGCPLMSDSAVLCALTVDHISHWESLFLAILASLLAFIACAPLSSFSRFFRQSAERDRRRLTLPERPTLFQELFSGGILHRKAP